MNQGDGEITQLLQAWRGGDEQALEKLTQVYRELHLAARRSISRERQGHTLQATALINELYLRLPDLQPVEETAEVLKISPDTVARDCRLAKSWLLREMSGGAHES